MNTDTPKVERCRSCNAEVVWARTANERMMPVDVETAPNGNIDLKFDPIALVWRATYLNAEQIEAMKGDLFRGKEINLHLSHFATCPHAKRWRKKDKQAA
jgi:hypothetical protein